MTTLTDSGARPSRTPVDLVWPSTAMLHDGDLRIGAVAMTDIVARHGTPTYVIDEDDVRSRCRDYVAAFGAGNVAYAAKALLTRAVARWITEENLGLYIGSAGELHVAASAGVTADRIMFYGNAKTPQDLQAAYAAGVDTIIIESLGDITRLAATAPVGQRVLLRVITGHEITDGVDRRFGLRIDNGEADAAVARIAAQPHLRLAGLDCSLGHQITRFAPYEREVRTLVEFLATAARRGPCPEVLNIGGGHAVAYTERDPAFPVDAFAERITAIADAHADRLGIAAPTLTVSPGRALVARAGVTLYRVIAATHDRHDRRLIAVDGGMSDCPAGTLCGGRHTASLFGRPSHAEAVTTIVVGRHNDTDDVVIADAALPADVRPGDLIAVAGTGAYHQSRASNYHHVGRPPLVAVRDGHEHLLIRRETFDDLDSRDLDEEA